ncbi:hypothetical protein ACTGWG_10160 [Streptococcus suis]
MIARHSSPSWYLGSGSEQGASHRRNQVGEQGRSGSLSARDQLSEQLHRNFYGGILQSLVVAYFKKHRPNYIRGQLSGDLSGKKGLIYFAIKHLLINCLTRPDFIAYEQEFQKNPSFNLICLLFRIPMVVYTVKIPQAYISNKKRFDIQIFEGFDAKEM